VTAYKTVALLNLALWVTYKKMWLHCIRNLLVSLLLPMQVRL